MSGDRLTPGDPLGGAPEAPARAGHYSEGPVPPGAFAPREERPAPPALEDLASWGRRALATIIDSVIVGVFAVVLIAVFGSAALFGEDDVGIGAALVALAVWMLVFIAVALVYAPLVMAQTNGQTLGKMAAGCRVVRVNGKRCDFWWAALREVAVKGVLIGFVAGWLTGGIAFLIDVLWPIPDKQNRALHDYVVDSRVVRA